MNAEPMTQNPSVEQILDMAWSCDEKVCPPCGMDGETQWMVWAFGEDGDGPHSIALCDTYEAAQAIVEAHKAMEAI